MTACDKRRYDNPEECENALSEIWGTPKPGRRLECRYYQCSECEWFHLTSRPLWEEME